MKKGFNSIHIFGPILTPPYTTAAFKGITSIGEHTGSILGPVPQHLPPSATNGLGAGNSAMNWKDLWRASRKAEGDMKGQSASVDCPSLVIVGSRVITWLHCIPQLGTLLPVHSTKKCFPTDKTRILDALILVMLQWGTTRDGGGGEHCLIINESHSP